MAAVRYEPNPAGLRAMLATPAMVGAMDHIGEIVRIRAEEISPVRSGAYAFGTEGPPGVVGGGFTVDARVREGIATVRISNDVRRGDYYYGVALEHGNSRIKKQRILGRALDALNLA